VFNDEFNIETTERRMVMNNVGKDLEGSGSGLIEILSSNLPGTEENYEKSQSRQPVSRPRFEPNTSPSEYKSRALHLHQTVW
jgi:hypothetical protein